MATQVMGARRRLRIRAALVALAFAAAVLVLAVQASAIWSSAPAPAARVERVVPDLGTSPIFPAAGERAINRARLHLGRVIPDQGTSAIFPAAGERAIKRAKFHREGILRFGPGVTGVPLANGRGSAAIDAPFNSNQA